MAGQTPISPHPGPQTEFLATSADIAIYGGAAGGGKSWGLLLEPLRHYATSGFGATIFRRTHPQIAAQGGLWSESQKLYPLLRATPYVSDYRWDFPKGAEVKFAHLQHEATVLNYQGSQIAMLGWDELTHFTEYQFTYMLSRNRSTCGVAPYVRATCNPDAASWVARWVEWFIDQTTGQPIPERSGRLRWFVRDGETLRWANSKAEIESEYPGKLPKSFTFIPAKLEDNPTLTSRDPAYKANLEALSRVDRERLLRGNWLITAAEGEWPAEYFGRHLYFADWPDQREICTIAWDPSKGSDSKFGDFSAFTVLVRGKDGMLYADASGSQRWPVEDGIDHLLELCREWNPDGIAIEGNQFQSLIRAMFMKRCGELGIVTPPVYTIVNTVKKEVRIRRLGPDLANRVLRLKGESPGSRLLAEQLMQFPEGEHDDFPDSLEMAKRLMVTLWNGKAKSAR